MSKIKFVLTYDDWNRACETMRQQGNGTSDDVLARITAKIIRLIISQVSIISHNPTIVDKETKRRIQSILHERIFHTLPHLKESATLDDCAFWLIDCLHQDELIVCVDNESLESDDYSVIDGSNLLIVTNASSAILTDEYWAGKDFKASHIVSAGSGSSNNDTGSSNEQETRTETLETFMSRKDDEYDTLFALCSQGVVGRVQADRDKNVTDSGDRTFLINLTNAPDASSWILSSSAAPAILRTSEILSVQQVMQMIQSHLTLDQRHVNNINSAKVDGDQSKKDVDIDRVTSREETDSHTTSFSDDSSIRKSTDNDTEGDSDYLVLLDTDYF